MPLFTKDWYAEVAKGNVDGHYPIRIWGVNEDLDATGTDDFIWNLNQLVYTFRSSADLDTISSSNAGDTQTIAIDYLDANWDRATQTKALNGQNKVTLDTACIRVLKIYNTSTTALSGDVYLYPAAEAITAGVPDAFTNVGAWIKQGDNESNMFQFSVPDEHYLLVTEFLLSALNSTATEIQSYLYAAEFGKPAGLKGTTSIVTSGTSHYTIRELPPILLPPKADMYLTAKSSANNVGITGKSQAMLIHQDYINAAGVL
jgi:hypothetical protein